jgi:hypothetical protein
MVRGDTNQGEDANGEKGFTTIGGNGKTSTAAAIDATVSAVSDKLFGKFNKEIGEALKRKCSRIHGENTTITKRYD